MPNALQLLCREWLVTESLAEVAVRADANFTSPSESTVAMVENSLEEDTQACSAVIRGNGRRTKTFRSGTTSQRPKGERSGSFVDRWCHIHRRYGPEARKCIEPCSFTKDMTSGNGPSNRQ